MEEALADGNNMVEQGECDGFNIGYNSGTAAGQTVMYPHIHLIPRRNGDVEDPVGGVRNTIPGKGNYKK
jgi:diadenosine tetraphosphate (Ap4A) HIT family hydrolase